MSKKPNIGMLDFMPHHAFEGRGGGFGGGGGGLPGIPSRPPLTPPSFNETTTLGRSAQIAYNPTPAQQLQGIKQQENVAYWQGNKTEAQTMAVDIGLTLPPTPTFNQGIANPRDARAWAQIEWGIDGYRQSLVTIDAGLGRRVSVTANYISVSVGMDPPGPNMQSAVLTMGAGITAWPGGSLAPAIRTRYIDALAQNTFSALLTVPQRAVMMLAPLVGDATTGAAVQTGLLSLNFFGYDAQQIVQWTFDYTKDAPSATPQPVPPDAFAFRLIYTGGPPGAASNIRIPFQVSL